MNRLRRDPDGGEPDAAVPTTSGPHPFPPAPTPRSAGAACLPSALTATVRVRDLDIRWNSNTNRTYQVEYRSDSTANMWLPLGSPVQGNGTTNCVIDSVPESPSKFYRV